MSFTHPFNRLLIGPSANSTGRNIERLLLAKRQDVNGHVECACSGMITYFVDIHGLQAGCNQCAFNVTNLREARP